jgi:hypothetical protein
MFLATVVPLHFLQAGYDPINQLMSELALGRYGGAMLVAFAGLAIAMLGAALLPASRSAKATAALASAAFLVAGIFPLGATSELHIGAIATAFVLAVLAMYFYPPRSLSWSLAAAVALSVVLGHTVLPMGIGQRMAAACLLAWLLALGSMRNAQRYNPS